MRLSTVLRDAFSHPIVLMLIPVLIGLEAPAQVPTVSSVSPPAPIIAYVGLTLTVTGTGFNAQSVVRIDGSPLTTSFGSSTSLGADLPAPQSTIAGIYSITVENPGAGGGISNGVPLTLLNPVPGINGIFPSPYLAGFPAGFGSVPTLYIDGGIFATNATVLLNGTPAPTIWIDRFSLQTSIAASYLAAPGTLSIQVQNPAPGGGLSNTLNIPVHAPELNSLGNIPIPIAPANSHTLFLFGDHFIPTAVVYLDGVQQLPIFIDEHQLRVPLNPALPQLQQRGAFAVTVSSAGILTDTLAAPVGGASNRGTIRRDPIAPAPGNTYSLLLEGGTPGSPFTLIVDAANPAPIYPFATSLSDYVLAVRPAPIGPGIWFPLTDGIGIYGPPTGTSYGASGSQTVGSFTLPSPAVGLAVTLQAVYLDAAAPEGYVLSWARREPL